jgi:hypothetical protein
VALDADGPLTLSIGASGTLRYDIRDQAGTPLPAKVVLVETGEALYLMPGEDTAAVVPGTYTISVTRGYEYEPVETTVEIPEGGEGTLSVTLDHVVPRSRGGRTTWENVVTACGRCNREKGDRTPDEAGMALRVALRAPSALQLGRRGMVVMGDPPVEWRPSPPAAVPGPWWRRT